MPSAALGIQFFIPIHFYFLWKKCICIDEKVNTPHFTDFQDLSRYICGKLKIIVLEGPAIFENLSYIFILMDYLNERYDQIMNIIISKLNCKRGPHYFREVLPVRSICLSIPRCKLSKFSNCQITLLHFKFRVHFPLQLLDYNCKLHFFQLDYILSFQILFHTFSIT